MPIIIETCDYCDQQGAVDINMTQVKDAFVHDFCLGRWQSRKARQAKIIGAFMLAVSFGLSSASPASAADISGQARVVDGDTLAINETYVGLYGIDAPEKDQTCFLSGVEQKCGIDATSHLLALISDLPVTCTGSDIDHYGRLLAVCMANGKNLNAQMVQDGWALSYRTDGLQYMLAGIDARSEHRGIWAGQFVEPWIWRKSHE